VIAQEREQPVLIPARPGLIGTRLVVMNLGPAHAAVDTEEKLDVEGGVALVRLGRQGRSGGPGESASLAGPVLAGDARRRQPGHPGKAGGYLLGGKHGKILVCEDSRVVKAPVDRCADALDLLEVIAGLTGRRGCAGITRRHGFAPLAMVIARH
jgi:hypothetical protein